MLLSEMIARLGELYLENGDLPMRDGSNNHELTGASVRGNSIYFEQCIELDAAALQQALIDMHAWTEARRLKITKWINI